MQNAERRTPNVERKTQSALIRVICGEKTAKKVEVEVKEVAGYGFAHSNGHR
ncbi:MAG: hypothetical protein PHI03_09705 [Bacteroidales bacterium]|nr:hypothetical protein [Bacteroidales bacterium]